MNGAIPALMRGEQAASIQARGAVMQPGNRKGGPGAPRFVPPRQIPLGGDTKKPFEQAENDASLTHSTGCTQLVASSQHALRARGYARMRVARTGVHACLCRG